MFQIMLVEICNGGVAAAAHHTPHLLRGAFGGTLRTRPPRRPRVSDGSAERTAHPAALLCSAVLLLSRECIHAARRVAGGTTLWQRLW